MFRQQFWFGNNLVPATATSGIDVALLWHSSVESPRPCPPSSSSWVTTRKNTQSRMRALQTRLDPRDLQAARHESVRRRGNRARPSDSFRKLAWPEVLDARRSGPTSSGSSPIASATPLVALVAVCGPGPIPRGCGARRSSLSGPLRPSPTTSTGAASRSTVRPSRSPTPTTTRDAAHAMIVHVERTRRTRGVSTHLRSVEGEHR